MCQLRCHYRINLYLFVIYLFLIEFHSLVTEIKVDSDVETLRRHQGVVIIINSNTTVY